MMTRELLDTVSTQMRAACVEAKHRMALLKDGRTVIKQGKSGDAMNDEELKVDVELGNLFLNLFTSRSHRPYYRSITIEGRTRHVNEDASQVAVDLFIDPCDGSLNVKNSVEGVLPHPYSACLTAVNAYETSEGQPQFNDIVVATVCDLRPGSGSLDWIAIRDPKLPLYKTHLGDKLAKTCSATKIDATKHTVIFEGYYPSNRDLINKAFAGEKGYFRSIGSAALEMAWVACGMAAAFICDQQKLHELGAGYALVKGAGGFICDFDGNRIDGEPYIFQTELPQPDGSKLFKATQRPIILACNADYAYELIQRLNRKHG